MRTLILAAMLLFTTSSSTIYRDEFHGNKSLASYNTCYRWACSAGWNGELERYTPKSVTISNGKLDLQAIQCTVIAHHITYHYCSGMVTTADKFSFLYGHVEAKMLLPKGQGLWPALWLLAENGQSTTELDMMEVLGNDPTQLHSGVHWLSGTQHKHKGTTFTAPDLSAGYHVYGVTWAADHITWYLDYKAYYTTTDVASIPHTPMYLLANLAVGGNWPGSPDSTTPFPSDFLIDWLHVTQ